MHDLSLTTTRETECGSSGQNRGSGSARAPSRGSDCGHPSATDSACPSCAQRGPSRRTDVGAHPPTDLEEDCRRGSCADHTKGALGQLLNG